MQLWRANTTPNFWVLWTLRVKKPGLVRLLKKKMESESSGQENLIFSYRASVMLWDSATYGVSRISATSMEEVRYHLIKYVYIYIVVLTFSLSIGIKKNWSNQHGCKFSSQSIDLLRLVFRFSFSKSPKHIVMTALLNYYRMERKKLYLIQKNKHYGGQFLKIDSKFWAHLSIEERCWTIFFSQLWDKKISSLQAQEDSNLKI